MKEFVILIPPSEGKQKGGDQKPLKTISASVKPILNKLINFNKDWGKLLGVKGKALEEAIAIIREKGFDVELVLALVVYGMALDAQGKSDLAMSHFQEAVEISRRGDTLFDTFIFFALTRLARSRGNLDEVKTDILSTLEDYKALNHRRGIAMGQSAMAHLLREEGNLL